MHICIAISCMHAGIYVHASACVLEMRSSHYAHKLEHYSYLAIPITLPIMLTDFTYYSNLKTS